MARLEHERERDEQAWIFDWLVKETGRVQNWEYDERGLPDSVRNYAMIPKHVGRQGLHREAVARAAEDVGHPATARDAYHQAIFSYHTAQHAIHADDNPEKARWYERLVVCFDRYMELSSPRIDRLEVPWEGSSIQVAFAPLPSSDPAPVVIWIPGMDDIKERAILSFAGQCRQRGLHMMAMDGPGQGVSNLRKLRITAENYERAVSSVIDYASERPEIDSEKILLTGMGTGSYWTVRAASQDDRVRALAAGPSTCFGDMTAAFEQVSPRYKRVFMYMSGIHDEAEFDREIAAHMTTRGIGATIKSPTLLVQGEFDPMSPLEEGMNLFEELSGPKEFWVLEDAFHGGMSRHSGLGNLRAAPFMLDWLADVALRDSVSEGHRRIKWVTPHCGGVGPHDTACQ